MYSVSRARRQSLPGASSPSSSSESSSNHPSGWSKHYAESKKSSDHLNQKKSIDCLDRLTSRTLSPPPETLPRKYSRSASILTTSSSGSIRSVRHPVLPPLNNSGAEGPRLKDYLDKPRLVSTMGRRPSRVEDDVDSLIPGLSKLTSYYKQTFLNVCNTCDSLNHKNPVSPLNNPPQQTSPHHRGM